MAIRLSYPIYVLVKSPWECEIGFDGIAFGRAILSTKECVALFHHEVEAEEFARDAGLDGATICGCENYEQLHATLERARTQFKFQYAGWPTADDEGYYNVIGIRELYAYR